MLFSSLTFVLFFAVYFSFHQALSQKHQILLIIVGSTIFYAYWNPVLVWVPYLLLILALGSAHIVTSGRQTTRRARLCACILLLLAPLLFFKYTNFAFGQLMGPFFGLERSLIDVSLPLGISFITFTLLAYVIELARGRTVERRMGPLAGFVLFFPHLIAGPILRPWELLPRLARQGRPRAAAGRFVAGFVLFTVGLVKKVVFADQIGVAVDAVYGAQTALTKAEYLLGIVGFCVQIYCDFSGYTDMAIGIALALGYRLPTNFRQPYAAISVVDFWRRWHITLSSWFRDYVYVPLGGNREGRTRQVINVILTMTIAGLWHGANWTFAIWGFVHGVGVAVSHTATQSGISRFIPNAAKLAMTFIFVTIAALRGKRWVEARARSCFEPMISMVFRGFQVAENLSRLPA